MVYAHEIKKRKNSKKYSVVKEFENEEEVIKYLNGNKLYCVGTPYIFTHLNLNDGSIISQRYNGLMCSPEKLRDMLVKEC